MSSPSDLLLSGAELVSGPEVGNPNKTIRIISQHIPLGPRAIFIIVTDRDVTVTQLPTTTLTEFLILTFSMDRRFIFLEIFKQQINKMMRMLSLSVFF